MTLTLCRDCLNFSDDVGENCARCGEERIVAHDELAALDIAHIDCDAFYASVEKRDDPSLKDKPLIVGHAGGRGVVTTACYIARQYGPRSAMPMFKALELCPDAVVIPPNMAKYKEVGITVSVGLSYNKFLAKMASDLDKPRGFSIIGRAEVTDFLAPLSVRKINGVGEATAKRMAAHGITTIGQLQSLAEMELVSRYGKFGRRLALYAQGEDNRKVVSHRPPKSISAETTFRTDIRASDQLHEAIQPLCERVAARLKRSDIAGATLVLKFKTSDFKVLTRNLRLVNPTQQAEVLFRNAIPLIDNEADGRAFRLIGVGVSDLCPSTQADPPDLFDSLA